MKKLLLLGVLFLSITGNAYAVFTPLDQSISELRDIITSRELKRILPPYETIMDIRRVQNGYIISTERFQIFVEIRYRLRGATAEKQQEDIKKEYTIQFNQPTQVK